MAAFSAFIRKCPSARLEAFLRTRDVNTPDDFDWTSKGRGVAFVRSIEGLLKALPARQQDAVKAELELLGELADDNGMTGAVEVCAGQDISLEGLEGIEDVLLMLAMQHPEMIDRVQVQTSFLRRNGGKQWARFQFSDDGTPWVLDVQSSRDGFLNDIAVTLNLPTHRKREADWYQSVRVDPRTGTEAHLIQATIYVEEHAHSELAFGDKSLERQTVQKVFEVGIACDPDERIVEICAKGGKPVRESCLRSFSKHFTSKSQTSFEVPRRNVRLEFLRREPELTITPEDGIERVEVSSLSFRSADGGFSLFEKRGDGETLYGFLKRRFGLASPLRASGWQIVSTTLRIMLSPRGGKAGRTLVVTLSAPNTTSVPNMTETERRFVYGLLERWKLLAPAPSNNKQLESAE